MDGEFLLEVLLVLEDLQGDGRSLLANEGRVLRRRKGGGRISIPGLGRRLVGVNTRGLRPFVVLRSGFGGRADGSESEGEG
jgi:hypothetical protein